MVSPKETSAQKRLQLLKRGKKGLLHLVFSRTGIMTLLILLQLGLMLLMVLRFQDYQVHYYGLFTLLSTVTVLYMLNSDTDPNAKITWLLILLLAPAAGMLLYAYVHTDLGHRALKERMRHINKLSQRTLPTSPTDHVLAEEYPQDAGLARFLRAAGGFVAYDRTDVRYFPLGEDFFPAFLEDLKSARQFIFLEYFIIENGWMWDQVEDILAEKARAGVEVRVLYDGTCEFTKLPHSFPEYLRSLGLKCRIFARVKPFVSTHYNYRDHRKIAVIDGRAAYTGGINLADEYVNKTHPFGHWKDTAVRLEGEAVRSFTLMFLQMWQVEDRKLTFEPWLSAPPAVSPAAGGYVIPYGDCPLDDQPVGEWVYTHILNTARDYVHIMTPYLILGHELEDALRFAARRGVEVSIILPGIPDKRLPFALAKSHYRSLIEAGVQIYEYTPGFIHAKSFVSDGIRGTVGTVNLDYRSLSHHFECGAYLLDTPVLAHVEADFQETLKRCHRVTWQEAAHPGFWWRLGGMLMKAFAPLL
ncbi:MAG: cardiolipin synthase [Clostridia bacterium]|nr:cardiolipin synthase [Clostridia bacterium]